MDLTTNICITVAGVFAAGALIVGIVQRFQLLKQARDIKEDLANRYTPDLFFPVNTEEIKEEEAEENEETEDIEVGEEE